MGAWAAGILPDAAKPAGRRAAGRPARPRMLRPPFLSLLGRWMDEVDQRPRRSCFRQPTNFEILA